MPSRRTATVQQRIEEAMREVGVLLIAFAPLDAAFTGGSRAARFAVAFFFGGLLLFAVAVGFERRRAHGP